MQTRKITVEVIAILFIILWIYAGLSKLLDYDTFKFQLGRSPYTENITGFVAWTLPIGEIVIAFLLVIKSTRLIGLYLSFFTMLMFTGYIYAMLNYSHYVPCSCGGILSEMDWDTHLIFNIVFTIIGLLGVMIHGNNGQRENSSNIQNAEIA